MAIDECPTSVGALFDTFGRGLRRHLCTDCNNLFAKFGEEVGGVCVCCMEDCEGADDATWGGEFVGIVEGFDGDDRGV